MNEQSERNRTMRIVYNAARAGDRSRLDRWLEIAGRFSPPTDRQLAHVDELLAAAHGPIAGQLDVFGGEAK